MKPKWQNILEAICAAPSVFLGEIVDGWQDFWAQEEQLVVEGEYVEESMDETEE